MPPKQPIQGVNTEHSVPTSHQKTKTVHTNTSFLSRHRDDLLILVVSAAKVVLNWVSTAALISSQFIVASNPLWAIAGNANEITLARAAEFAPLHWFLLVGLVRSCIADPINWYLGRKSVDAAQKPETWLSGALRALRRVGVWLRDTLRLNGILDALKALKKYLRPDSLRWLLIVQPGSPFTYVAGLTGMRLTVMMLHVGFGSLLRLSVIWFGFRFVAWV